MTSRSLPLALVLAASALIVSGCSPEAAVPSAPPAAEAEPLFASDEEALEAAEAAYRQYLAVSDEVFSNGGADVERLESVSTGEVLDEDRERATDYRNESLRQEGATRIVQFELQQVEPGDPTTITAYACLDPLSIRVIDADGNLVSAEDLPATVTFETTFVAESADQILLASSEVWGSGASCE